MKLSIDLGGTNIRIAQVEKGNCLNKVSVPCLAQQDASTVLNQLSQLIRNMMNEQVDGIGIGVPSIVDRSVRRTMPNPNMKNYKSGTKRSSGAVRNLTAKSPKRRNVLERLTGRIRTA